MKLKMLMSAGKRVPWVSTEGFCKDPKILSRDPMSNALTP